MTQANLTALFFEQLATSAPNIEVRAAIANTSDRLHSFRSVEHIVLEPILGELEEMALTRSTQLQAIRQHHMRRIKAAPPILRAHASRQGNYISIINFL